MMRCVPKSMAASSLSLNSLPLQPPSHPPPRSSSVATPTTLNNSGNLKPIVIYGNPPTYVSAPARRIVAG